MKTVAPVLMLLPGAASLHVVFGAHNVPHPAKAATGGEDAFFFDDRLGTFGVADGVGGSAREGMVDPGEFSRDVLQRCYTVASTTWPAPKLTEALEVATGCPTDLGGSTTLVLGQLEDNQLRLLNLGDSGAMLLRPSIYNFPGPNGEDMPILFPRTVLRSQDQSHGWVSVARCPGPCSIGAPHVPFCPTFDLPQARPPTDKLTRSPSRPLALPPSLALRIGRTRSTQQTLTAPALSSTRSRRASRMAT